MLNRKLGALLLTRNIFHNSVAQVAIRSRAIMISRCIWHHIEQPIVTLAGYLGTTSKLCTISMDDARYMQQWHMQKWQRNLSK